MLCASAAGYVLPVSGDEERALPPSRRTEHGAEDGGRHRAYQAVQSPKHGYYSKLAKAELAEREVLRACREMLVGFE